MIEFLSFPVETRKQLIDQVSIQTGLPQNAIEKDWWVTLVLKALFSLPMSEHFIFKGGTSLSKGWSLIQRLSEDLDIALAPEAFGKPYDPKASRTYVKQLKKLGCEYTSTVIFEALRAQMKTMGVPDGLITFEVEPVRPDIPDKDPQTILVHYPPLFEPSPYMPPRVKIEFGVRALRIPFAPVWISSILGKEGDFPGYKEQPFEVPAVEPHKTFMEKLLLLHEKFEKGVFDDQPAERQSRHLSDIGTMTLVGIAEAVQSDTELYGTLLEHRRVYVGEKKVDYNRMKLHELKFLPPHNLLPAFREDYRKMQAEMLYGTQPSFDELIATLRRLNGFLVVQGVQVDIDHVIATAIQQIVTIDETTELYTTTVEVVNRPEREGDPVTKIASFEVELLVMEKQLLPHRIIRIE